jgi:vacuolar-type H+-ATPase subunit E/Vma4
VSLQAILDAIRAAGEKQVIAIESRARTQVEQVLADARTEARQLRDESCAGAAAPAAAACAHILLQARLEALQIIADAREALVDEALSRTRECLASLRADAIYTDVLRRMTVEALIELNGGLEHAEKTRLEADPRDRELLEGLLHDLGLHLPTSYQLNCQGGLIAKSDDGRVVVINTLEARLARATPYLCHYLTVLFENEAKERTCQVMTMAMPACER